MNAPEAEVDTPVSPEVRNEIARIIEAIRKDDTRDKEDIITYAREVVAIRRSALQSTAPEAEVDTKALLPCPFCGWEATVVRGGPGNHFIQCQGCRATSDDLSLERAVTAWNRRSALSTLQVQTSEAVAHRYRDKRPPVSEWLPVLTPGDLEYLLSRSDVYEVQPLYAPASSERREGP